MGRKDKKVDPTRLFIQGRLDSNLRPNEQPIINVFRRMMDTVNPDDPSGNRYNMRQVIVKMATEWLGLDRKKVDPIEVQLNEIRELIIESHHILLNTLSGLDLNNYVDANTGRSMQDEIGDELQRLNEESLKNVTADNVHIVDDIDEDEPEGW